MGYDDAWETSVGAHGALEALAPNLHWVWALVPGAPVARNMVIHRLPDGSLWVHSCICLDAVQMAAVDALGPVRFIVVPNEGHRLDIRRWKKRYPEARVLAPRNARKKVEEVITVEQDCEDALPAIGVRFHVPDGMKEGYELVYEVDLEGGGRALVVNDVLSKRHPHGPTGIGGAIGKIVGPPGGELGQARIVRFMFGKDRAAFRRFVEKLASVPDLRVLTTSHGPPIQGDVAAALRGALARV